MVNRESFPPCSHCGSDNVLPFEDDTPVGSNTTIFVAVLAAILVICGYFLFVITSYLYYPIVVFIAIIATTKVINKHQEEKKEIIYMDRDYVCLDCSRFFRR